MTMGIKIVSAAAVAIALTGILAGCGTSGQAADPYPNLNIPMVPAAEQLTPAERNAKAAALRPLRAGPAQPVPASRADRLRAIGQSHAEETLRQIESE